MNLSESIPFTPSFFKNQALKTAQRIRADALKGIFQNGMRDSKLSRQYAKYKANYMERFTTRKYKKGTKHIAPGTVTHKGTKIKSLLPGTSVKSNFVGYSNMYLTGQTLDSLLPSEFDANGFVLTFNNPGLVNKRIINNEKYGRIIADISEPNVDLILKDMNALLDEGIEKWCREDIKITVGV